ncbi:MAG: hypothetical protein JO360_01595 [Acidobacteria bacterium]|nr:hypothetical protein [Acidobacteriota bacterium]
MKRKTGALFLTLILAGLAHGFQTNNEWAQVAPAGGRFTILMPGTPKSKIETADSQYGPYTTYLFTSGSPQAIYLAGWVDYAPAFKFGVEAELKANRDNFLKGINARLLTEKAIKLDGNPGIEFTAESDDVQFITSRVYIVGARPYQLIAMTNLKEELGNVDKFLSSFKLTTK